MKKHFLQISIASFSIFLILFSSCKKETPDTETQSSVDNAICENEFNSRIQLVNFIAMNSYKIKSIQAGGLLITTDTINRIITIDYGVDGITDTIDGDGRLRKGVIKATFDSLWHKPNAKATVELIGYSVSNNGGASYIGYSANSITIKRIDSISYNYVITGGNCAGTNYSLGWETNRNVIQTEGFTSTANVNDDSYSSTGTSTGVDRNGKSYKVSITSPVVKRTGCAWMESGKLDLIPEGISTRTIDYGSGTCDNKVSLLINGNTFTFSMN